MELETPTRFGREFVKRVYGSVKESDECRPKIISRQMSY